VINVNFSKFQVLPESNFKNEGFPRPNTLKQKVSQALEMGVNQKIKKKINISRVIKSIKRILKMKKNVFNQYGQEIADESWMILIINKFGTFYYFIDEVL